MKKKYVPQLAIKENNEKKVLEFLRDRPARFSELLEHTGLSKRGLQEVLERMQKGNTIEKIIYNNKEAYAITDFGFVYFQERLWHAFGTMMDMRIENPLYLHSDLFFGGSMDLIANDQSIEHPLFNTIPDTKEISQFLLQHIFYDINERQIILDKRSDGKLVLAFEFDMGELSEEISTAQRVIEDLKNRVDIIEDRLLPLKDVEPDIARHRITQLLDTINWLSTPDVYKELRGTMVHIVNDETHPELFADINNELLSIVKNAIKRRNWKIDFPAISKKLNADAHNNSLEHVSEIYYYTEALQILHLDDEEFLNNYEVFTDFMREFAEERVQKAMEEHEMAQESDQGDLH